MTETRSGPSPASPSSREPAVEVDGHVGADRRVQRRDVFVLQAVVTHPDRWRGGKVGDRVDGGGVVMPVDDLGFESDVIECVHHADTEPAKSVGW